MCLGFISLQIQLWAVSCNKVPIRASMVEEIKSYYYKDAALFAEPFEVSVPSAWLDNMSKLDMVKPIVSIEHRIAFVLPLGCCP